ncbi:MAG: PfkB family carbohydrate kinase [Candidatus Dormibacteria bacterium]
MKRPRLSNRPPTAGPGDVEAGTAAAPAYGPDLTRATPTVVTFGELLLRLATTGHDRLGQSGRLQLDFGGAEANVAVALCQLGIRSRFVSRLPDNAIATSGLRFMNGLQVDTSRVLFGGARMGIYFLEAGLSQRPSRVIYDRTGSSMSSIAVGDIQWEGVLDGCQWFHTSGITPALSASAAAATIEAITAAKRAGLKVSVDLNYRSQLWQWTDSPSQTMSALLDCADVVFTNEEDLDKVFGIKVPSPGAGTARLDPRHYALPCLELQNRFANLKAVAVTLRESVSASDNYWTAALSTPEGFYVSRRYHISPVLDRVGAGDAFAAASIRQMILGTASSQEVLEFATAAACLKHTIRGDWNLVSLDEIGRLIDGDGTGRILR